MLLQMLAMLASFDLHLWHYLLALHSVDRRLDGFDLFGQDFELVLRCQVRLHFVSPSNFQSSRRVIGHFV